MKTKKLVKQLRKAAFNTQQNTVHATDHVEAIERHLLDNQEGQRLVVDAAKLIAEHRKELEDNLRRCNLKPEDSDYARNVEWLIKRFTISSSIAEFVLELFGKRLRVSKK